MNSRKFTATRLVVSASVFLAVLYNYAFFRNVLVIYPLTWDKLPFLCSLFLVLVCFTALMLMAVSSKYTLKPALILVLVASSFASYFMNTFNVVIDVGMLRNAVQTNAAETMDLMNFKLLMYFLLFGVLPSVLIYKVRVDYGPWKTEVFSKLKHMAVLVLVLLVTVLVFSKNYTSFFREHKILRYYTNPITWIYSTIRLSAGTLKAEARTVRPIGKDAAIPSIRHRQGIDHPGDRRSGPGGQVFAERVRQGDQSPSRQRGRHQLHQFLLERHTRRRSPSPACSPFSEGRVTANKRPGKPKTCSMCCNMRA